MPECRIQKINRLERAVLAIESKPIQKGRILFTGSSGFTRWSEAYGNRNLEDDIRMKDGSPAAINHGIGGSVADEILYYYPRLVRPYEPRALVLRVFPNDYTNGYSPEEIVDLYSRIFLWARVDFPGIRLYACDATPNTLHLGNQDWLAKATEFNARLKEYCDRYEDCTYICHASFPGYFSDPADVGDYFKIRKDLYIEDGLHFTPEGYEVYRDMFLQALDDIL